VADISKSNGFESDNDANGSDLTPFTSARFSNFTLIGPRASATSVGNSNYGSGAHLRRNTKESIYNTVIMGYPTGLLIDGSKGVPTDLHITDSSLQFKNNIIAGSTTPVKYSASATTPTGFNVNEWFLNPVNGNTVLATNDEVMLTSAFNYAAPDLTPQAGSPLLGGASFIDPKLAQFTQVDYRGAVGANDNWYKGWTLFN
jgi:hypothetical protein